MRSLAPLALVALLTACPTYNSEPYLSSQDGLMDADEWAKYGPEHAVVVATGREFAQSDAAGAAEYARKNELVSDVAVDSLGSRMVITFKSGWKAQVNPITDGKAASETAGL